MLTAPFCNCFFLRVGFERIPKKHLLTGFVFLEHSGFSSLNMLPFAVTLLHVACFLRNTYRLTKLTWHLCQYWSAVDSYTPEFVQDFSWIQNGQPFHMFFTWKFLDDTSACCPCPSWPFWTGCFMENGILSARNINRTASKPNGSKLWEAFIYIMIWAWIRIHIQFFTWFVDGCFYMFDH